MDLWPPRFFLEGDYLTRNLSEKKKSSILPAVQQIHHKVTYRQRLSDALKISLICLRVQ